jgi:hypothetical protein
MILIFFSLNLPPFIYRKAIGEGDVSFLWPFLFIYLLSSAFTTGFLLVKGYRRIFAQSIFLKFLSF